MPKDVPQDVPQQVGRIAFREEGDNWAAYYAMPGTMEGALFLGSIRLAVAQQNERVKIGFIDLMCELVGDIIYERFGIRGKLGWGEPVRAPEAERAGKA